MNLEKNNYFVHTLRNYENREGRHIELDRKGYDASTNKIESLSNEEINVKGIELDESAVLSIKGTFTSKDTILVSEYHVHNNVLRDGTSYLGLGLVLIFWIHIVVNHLRRNK